MSIIAFVLDEITQHRIWSNFPPKFPDVFTHHVTFGFGGNIGQGHPDVYRHVEAYGYMCDESLECLLVTVNGNSFREDGKLFHVTLSLDKSKGRKPVESNNLITDSTAICQQFTPILLTGRMQFI